MLQVSRRQARSLRFRARPIKTEGCTSCHVTHGSAQSAHAQIQQRQHALPAVPHDVDLQRRARNAFIPQPGHPIPGMHALPRANSRIELRSHLFQIVMTMTMHGRSARSLPLCILLAVLLFAPLSRAQVNPNFSDQKGVDSGDYNIQQSAEFGYRANWINGNQDTYDTFVNLGDGVRLLQLHPGLALDRPPRPFLRQPQLQQLRLWWRPERCLAPQHHKNKWYDFRDFSARQKFLGLQPLRQSAESRNFQARLC